MSARNRATSGVDWHHIQQHRPIRIRQTDTNPILTEAGSIPT